MYSPFNQFPLFATMLSISKQSYLNIIVLQEIEAKTLADSLVDGLNPMLLLRAWHRGVTSIILTESESREDELQQNRLLSQLYKLEKNSMQSREYITRKLCSQSIYQNPKTGISGKVFKRLVHISGNRFLNFKTC